MSHDAAQSQLLLLEELRGEREEGALLQSRDANVEISRIQGLISLMLDQMQQLVEGPRQVLALLGALLEEFGVQRRHLSLNSRAACRRNRRFDRVVG